jgi:hypothetical protein
MDEKLERIIAKGTSPGNLDATLGATWAVLLL